MENMRCPTCQSEVLLEVTMAEEDASAVTVTARSAAGG